MSKGENATTQETQRILEQIVLRAKSLKANVDVVRCTAICVHLALSSQKAEQDQEIAICIQRNITDELGQLGEQVQALVADIKSTLTLTGNGRPH